MSALRTLAVLLVVLGLAVLEIVSGLDQIDRLRAQRRVELTGLVERDLERTAAAVSALLDLQQHQARRLARQPAVTEALIVGRTPDEAWMDDVLATVEDARTLHVIPARGMPSGRRRVGAEGTAPAPPLDPAALSRILHDGLLLTDPGTTEAAASMAVPIPAPDDGTPLGHLVLGSDAAALTALIDGFSSLPGVEARLVAGDVATQAPAVPASDDRDLVLGARVFRGGSPPTTWHLDGVLPRAALDAALATTGGAYTWIIASMVIALVVLAVVGAVVLRLSQRTFRLQETERYLRWIRRVTDRYRALMEGAADLILILEPRTGVIREANAVARETLGLPGREFPGPDDVDTAIHTLLPMLVGLSVDRFEAALAQAGEGRPIAERGLQVRAHDGHVLTVDAQLALIDLGDERVVELSLRDVTHQRDMERQLQTSERLASLGLLTAGVAHEINNPLEGVGNYLSLLGRDDLEPEKHTRYLEQTRRGFDRIRDIVRDLLSFARPSMESGHADLVEVVTSALGLAGFAGGFRGIGIETSGLDDPMPVAGDPRRLEQVVLNLLLNASQAMGGSGTVRIHGMHVTSDDGTECACLTLADSGPGIPAGDLDRLFDPFFSGRGGTGLGLSVSFGIVAAHGGTLRARNLDGGGAEFTLTLPRSMPPSMRRKNGQADAPGDTTP